MPRLFGQEQHAIRIELRITCHRAIEPVGEHAGAGERALGRPVEHRELGFDIGFADVPLAGGEQTLAVRRESRLTPGMRVVRQTSRLTALAGHVPQLRGGEPEGRRIAIGARHEHEARPIGRPFDRQRIATLAAGTGVSALPHQL